VTGNRQSASALMAVVCLLASVSAGTQDNREKEKVSIHPIRIQKI